MNVKLSCLGILVTGFIILAGCQNTSQSKSDDEQEPAYKSGQAPTGISTDDKLSDTGKTPDISRGACRIMADIIDVSDDGAMAVVEEVRGYGPNYAYGFPLEGDTLKIVGAESDMWTEGRSMMLEVRPAFEGYRDEDVKIVKYVKTVAK
ncbi:MAG: hypothetical protein WBB45_04840 [Cyclobacteriaceae bacterium]